MVSIKYAIYVVVALLVCGMQHVAEARRNKLHPHHQILTATHTPLDSLFTYTENSDLFRFLADYRTVESREVPVGENSQTPTLAFDSLETNSTYQIICDIPGVDKSDVSLSLVHKELTISAKRTTVKDEDGVVYRRVERPQGELTRTITLPEDCQTDKISAETKDGVLIITIPRVQKTNLLNGAVKIEVK